MVDERKLIHKFRSSKLQGLFIAADKAGWRWRKGGSHIVMYPPTGTRPLILSLTAYDGPATKSTEAQFRRGGLDI